MTKKRQEKLKKEKNYVARFHEDISAVMTGGRIAFEIVGVESKPIQRIYLNNILVKKASNKREIKHVEDVLYNKVTIGGEPVDNVGDLRDSEGTSEMNVDYLVVSYLSYGKP